MTEEQAKTKICCGPFVIACILEKSPNINCEGSRCMAWRSRTNKQMGYDRNPDDIYPDGYYCGLAGKP